MYLPSYTCSRAIGWVNAIHVEGEIGRYVLELGTNLCHERSKGLVPALSSKHLLDTLERRENVSLELC